MGTPATPLLVQILDRIVTVLRSIRAGDTYHYTVGKKCVKGFRVFAEAPDFPFDMVFMGSDHMNPEYGPDHHVFLYPTFVIASYCDDEKGDPATKLVKHLNDVRKAIEADLQNSDSGSLANLCRWDHLGPCVTDEGELGIDGAAGFRQDIHFCLSGTWSDF